MVIAVIKMRIAQGMVVVVEHSDRVHFGGNDDGSNDGSWPSVGFGRETNRHIRYLGV